MVINAFINDIKQPIKKIPQSQNPPLPGGANQKTITTRNIIPIVNI